MTTPITTNDNGGTHAVAFSPDGKLMAISSLHFDVDKANDAGTGAISLAHVASGVVQWRRTFPGLAKPVAFYAEGPSVVGLHGDASMRFRDANQPQGSQKACQLRLLPATAAERSADTAMRKWCESEHLLSLIPPLSDRERIFLVY